MHFCLGLSLDLNFSLFIFCVYSFTRTLLVENQLYQKNPGIEAGVFLIDE
jgi:hypothetical protein